MKNQILDIQYKDSIYDFLAKDEKILWEGNAKLDQYSISRSKKKWCETEAREFLIIILTIS